MGVYIALSLSLSLSLSHTHTHTLALQVVAQLARQSQRAVKQEQHPVKQVKQADAPAPLGNTLTQAAAK
jgi:hypothetical protein